MPDKTLYAYTEGVLEPLDRDYFKNTLKFMPGVKGVGAIDKPSVAAPANTIYGIEVRFDDTKLLGPGSSWEFTKWNWIDSVGFVSCLAVSGAILICFWLVLRAAAV